ncbi:MAG: DNA mismatch repair endonuclease MutL [Pseudoramibacter sp.]
MKIKMLAPTTIEKIAAGEVIVRPASVVKELAENAIDAGSDHIHVAIEQGGKRSIRIRDNGEGIPYNEVRLAFTRHATSKLSEIEDLNHLETLGFRGEALASIAAVSHVTIRTIAKTEELGSESIFEGGRCVNQRVMPYNRGTAIEVKDLFYNVPARQKHMMKDKTEERAIHQMMGRIALSHPEIAFKLTADGRDVFATPGDGKLQSVIECLYGRTFFNSLRKLEAKNEPMELQGYIGDLTSMRSSKDRQILFINGRTVENRGLSRAFEEAYQGYLMNHKHPVGIIFMTLPGRMLDVNVHPSKMEIGILNQSLVDILFRQEIRRTVQRMDLTVDLGKKLAEPQESRKEAPLFKKQETRSEQFKVDTKFQPEVLAPLQRKAEPFTVKEAVTPLKIAAKPQQAALLKKESIQQPLNNPAAADAGRPHLDLHHVRIVGQLFKTFILLEKEDSAILIDQHAAHEAFMFENLRKKMISEAQIPSQTLLVPQTVDVSREMVIQFENVKDQLSQKGFQCDVFGETTMLVRGVPVLLGEPQSADMLPLWIENLLTGDPALKEKQWLKIATMACKAAVKGNQELTKEEIQKLLEDLMTLKNPYTCPHGRPIILYLKKYELEKLFKRVVS